MTCNCKTDIEAKLAQRHAEQTPEDTDHKAMLKGYGIVFGPQAGLRPYAEVELTRQKVVKRTGEKKLTKSILNMFFTHCPYCGKSLADGSPA